MNKLDKIKEILINKDLKATTPRIIIYEALSKMHNHPTAEDVYLAIKEKYPSISLSTVYNTLELFLKHRIISTVKSDLGALHYETVQEPHHHLYCEESNKIEDYYNSELDELLQDFFKKNSISNFDIQELKLQIKGKFINKKGNQNDKK